jgi:phosphoribosyl-AMP cyclohydrolase
VIDLQFTCLIGHFPIDIVLINVIKQFNQSKKLLMKKFAQIGSVAIIASSAYMYYSATRPKIFLLLGPSGVGKDVFHFKLIFPRPSSTEQQTN